jgi:hypothetical protein
LASEKNLLTNWLEDFRAQFGQYEEAQLTIKKVEDALRLYNTAILGGMLNVNLKKAIEARAPDSNLEYGLEHHLSSFVNSIKEGIPTDKRFVDDYLEKLEKLNGKLIEWLEDFRSRFGQYNEAESTIHRVEDALKLYRLTIAASKVKLDVARARDARKAQGSVLEYGFEHHVERFVDAVSE